MLGKMKITIKKAGLWKHCIKQKSLVLNLSSFCVLYIFFKNWLIWLQIGVKQAKMSKMLIFGLFKAQNDPDAQICAECHLYYMMGCIKGSYDSKFHDGSSFGSKVMAKKLIF